jgi:hypothetical protein
MSVYRPQTGFDINSIVEKYAVPALLGFLQGKSEAQYHDIMRQRPDFITYYRDNNKMSWGLVMAAAPAFRPIRLIPEVEGRRVVHLIKQRGWKVYRREYDVFVDNIRRFVYMLNTG